MTDSTEWLYVGDEIFFGKWVIWCTAGRGSTYRSNNRKMLALFAFKSLCQKTLNVMKDESECTKSPLKCLITFSRFSVVKSVCLSAVEASPLIFSLFLPLQTYYNHHILALLQALVTSRTSPELEQLEEEDRRLSRSLDNVVQNPYQVRCKLALLPLSERWLSGGMVSHGMDLGCRDWALIPTAFRKGRLVVITWSLVSSSWRSLCSLKLYFKEPEDIR